jgi:membrane protease subunit HflC
MKNVSTLNLIAGAVLATILLTSMSLFTVDERERAFVLQLGQPVGDTIVGPGLHFKIPFVQEVRRFDARILSVDPQPAQIVISSSRDNPLVAAARGALAESIEGKTDADSPPKAKAQIDDEMVSGEPIIVDTFARYRITDPLKFMKTLGTVDVAAQRIESIMNDSTRGVLGRSTMRELLSPERTRIMEDIKKMANDKIKADNLGITIIDIRIVRADLTPGLRQSTVTRMISELKERATETRAKGEESALEIRSTADRERTVLLAEAERDSQALRGEGDKLAIAIYANAYNKDKDFYQYSRTLEAYRNTLARPETKLILSPDNAFLKYMKQGAGQ